MHLCFVFRGTPGLFRGGPPLPRSPSLSQNSPDPPYTPDLASAIFRGLPYSSDPSGLLPLAIFGLPHPPWPSQASRPLPITSDTFLTSAGLAPASADTFRLPRFVSNRSRPLFLFRKLFFPSLAPPKEEGSGYASTNLIPTSYSHLPPPSDPLLHFPWPSALLPCLPWISRILRSFSTPLFPSRAPLRASEALLTQLRLASTSLTLPQTTE